MWGSLWLSGGLQGVPSNNGSKTASMRPCCSTTVIDDHYGSQPASTCNVVLPVVASRMRNGSRTAAYKGVRHDHNDVSRTTLQQHAASKHIGCMDEF